MPVFTDTLGSVLASARVHLNDIPASIFTDAVLIPLAQEAHRELQAELLRLDAPTTQGFTMVTLPAGQTDLTNQVGFPADLAFPVALRESADPPVAFTAMTEVDLASFLTYTTAATCRVWLWLSNFLYCGPASANRTILLDYRYKFTIPTAIGHVIGIIKGEQYMSYRTAALGAQMLGGDVEWERLQAQAVEHLQKVLDYHRGQQRSLWRP